MSVVRSSLFIGRQMSRANCRLNVIPRLVGYAIPKFPRPNREARASNFFDCKPNFHGYYFSKRNMSTQEEINWSIVAKNEILSFMENCMLKIGAPVSHAKSLANVLVAADYRGHYSHGLNRLEMYVNDIKNKMTACDVEPKIIKETPATAWVDGQNVLGPVVGEMCMKLAIEKAKNVGVGWVVAKGSNHYGIAGWYSMMAVEEGLVGISTTNTSPLVVPTRAKERALGTNPIAVGAPGNKSDSFVLDMATSAVAFGKVEINDRKGLDIPEGWGCDKNGKDTCNAKEVIEGGGLLPLGGMEINSGYKGYGLGVMVDVLGGILGGSVVGKNIRQWKETDRPANLGQLFIAVNPDAFAPEFPDRLQSFMDELRCMEPAKNEMKVMVPGDPERQHEQKCDKLGGIPYHPNQIDFLLNLSKELDVAPPSIKTPSQ